MLMNSKAQSLPKWCENGVLGAPGLPKSGPGGSRGGPGGSRGAPGEVPVPGRCPGTPSGALGLDFGLPLEIILGAISDQFFVCFLLFFIMNFCIVF